MDSLPKGVKCIINRFVDRKFFNEFNEQYIDVKYELIDSTREICRVQGKADFANPNFIFDNAHYSIQRCEKCHTMWMCRLVIQFFQVSCNHCTFH